MGGHCGAMAALLRKNVFTLWLLVAVLLAVCVPEWAADGGPLRGEWTTLLGVMVIFLLQGLSLPSDELTAGYRPLRLHGFVLSWNFLFFPLVTWGLLWLFGGGLGVALQLGFLLLAIMPTTVASAIAFTSLAGGATANALFSTVYSNVAAVWVVPAVCVAYMAANLEVSIPLVPLLAKLAVLIVAPLVVGQMVHRMFPVQASALGARTKWLSQLMILFIVHAAFANGVQSGLLGDLTGVQLGMVVLLVAGLLGVVSGLVWASSSWLRLSGGQRIAGFYCASQKSLATGLPLAASVIAATDGAVESALLIVPLMVYHPLQLMLAGGLSARLARG